MRRSGGDAQSFERRYLRNIAVGEGCNCGELVIRDNEDKITRGGTLSELLAALIARIRGRKSGDGKATAVEADDGQGKQAR